MFRISVNPGQCKQIFPIGLLFQKISDIEFSKGEVISATHSILYRRIKTILFGNYELIRISELEETLEFIQTSKLWAV
jgi:hypothetical protein